MKHAAIVSVLAAFLVYLGGDFELATLCTNMAIVYAVLATIQDKEKE